MKAIFLTKIDIGCLFFKGNLNRAPSGLNMFTSSGLWHSRLDSSEFQTPVELTWYYPSWLGTVYSEEQCHR